MFASLKNKIREETGSDFSKLTAKITSSTLQRVDSLRGRSQQGSSSSINSLVSSDSLKDESDEVRRRLSKIEADYQRRIEQKEQEFRDTLAEKDKQFSILEIERNSLKEALKTAEEFRVKLVEHQEDKEQIESFQNQELSKVKKLVLLREQELAEKTNALKDATSQLEKLRSEVNRLRRQEELLSDVQNNANTEIKVMKKNLQNAEVELNKIGGECNKLKLSANSEQQTNGSLRQIITKLEKELNEEKINSLNVQKTLTRVTSEKNTALLRNAEISQQMEIIKQEKRRQENDTIELNTKILNLEDETKKLKECKQLEEQFKLTINELEEQIKEKNKNIKTLQLRLADMKKTLQQELNLNNYNTDCHDGNVAILMPSHMSTKNHTNSIRRGGSCGNNSVGNSDDDEVNFKYLKHVVIKFLTSEYEAQHLIKAISTVLKFTPEEEKLVSDTLEWKKSWFGGSRPRLTSGQKKALSS